MGSYSRSCTKQKWCNALVVLLIVVLVALVAFVWTQVTQGAFKSQTARTHSDYSKGDAGRVGDGDGDGDGKGGDVMVEHPRSNNETDKVLTKVFKDSSHLNDLTAPDIQENFVKPLKISPLPLHDHDILYDQIYHNITHNTAERPLLRHHSGHFRHRTAEVWDPHPQYEIAAFGRILHLELTYNAGFLANSLPVHYITDNYTNRVVHDNKQLSPGNTGHSIGCFYTGVVQGDELSRVDVSLCNGMTGYIKTNDSSYFIEPVEHFRNNSITSILHRIKKVSHQSEATLYNNDVMAEDSDEDCETIITDDDVAEVLTKVIPDDAYPTDDETLPKNHAITKRQVRFEGSDNHPSRLSSRQHVVPLSGEPRHNDSSFVTPFPLHGRRSTRDTDSNWDQLLYSTSLEDKGDSILVYEDYQRKRLPFFIEILVVADKTMFEYHETTEKLEEYILILMSHVASLYKDATIGNSISLAVVAIEILPDQAFESKTAEEMLRKFCEWRQKIVFQERYDTALLFTRETLCKNTTPIICNTLGVAEVGSMCSANTSCAVIKDKGLSTSYTIAHELGHILGMIHDEDKMCNPHHDGGTAKMGHYIMTKMLQSGRKPWHWSPCSKYYLTEFINSDRAKCLLDSPHQDYLPTELQKFPGENFEVDKQCELEFGPGNKVCSYMPICSSLWCATEISESEGCRTQHMPWADGTKCGEGSWCHYGDCIRADRQSLSPVNGDWGQWQPWSTCTRTCGGGIKQSKRFCDSPPPANGGYYCMGQSTRYKSCNYQSCDIKSPDFREVQCSEFNGNTRGIPFLSSNVTWVPKYGMNREYECKLYCRVSLSISTFVLKEKVIDGTKCRMNTFDLCVNGLCRQAGCDNILNSNTTLDDCGTCGGDNSKCEEIKGNYDISKYGYQRVITIPKGSSNIVIQQQGVNDTHIDENYLALVDDLTGDYILNGDNIVSQFSKDFKFGDIKFYYSGSENNIEEVRTPKLAKLTRDLRVEVLSVGKIHSPSVTYYYTIGREDSPRYGWRLYKKQLEPCNSMCSGVQFINPDCIELATNLHVPDHNCRNYDKLSHTEQRDCNTHCELIWNVAQRSPCSAYCGRGFSQITYNCMNIDKKILRLQIFTAYPGNYGQIVEDKHCSYLTRPAEYETCDGQCNKMRWSYEPWSECSATCGGGVKKREAICVDNNSRTIDDLHCKDLEKNHLLGCNHDKCPSWLDGDWSSCSTTCGAGVQRREHFCQVDNRLYDSMACDENLMPPTVQSCYLGACPTTTTSTTTTTTSTTTTTARSTTTSTTTQATTTATAATAPPTGIMYVRWISGNWSRCSVSCGEGNYTRSVTCRDMYGEENVDARYCEKYLRPAETKKCMQRPCEDYFHNTVTPLQRINSNSIGRNGYVSMANPLVDDVTYIWVNDKWSQCSRTCGRGTMTRTVICQQTTKYVTKQVPHHYCQPPIPPHSSPCHSAPCHHNTAVAAQPPVVVRWRTDPWHVCDPVTCQQRRRVTCVSLLVTGGNDVMPSDGGGGAGGVTVLPEERCRRAERPAEMRQCTEDQCIRRSQVAWRMGKWGSCSKPCGGTKNRLVWCEDGTRDVRLVDGYCNHVKKPKSSRKCIRNTCNYTWVEKEWSTCSSTCDYGTQERKVTCHHMKNGYPDNRAIEQPYSRSPRHFCDLNSKPATRQRCLVRHCNDLYSWTADPWKKCSRPCGRKGRQVRRLHCISRNGTQVQRHLCQRNLKPPRKQKCNQRKCYTSCSDVRQLNRTQSNGEYTLEIHGKPANIFCFNMDSNQPTEYVTLHDSQVNYAEIYNKRLKNSDECPYQGQRNDACDCLEMSSNEAGKTDFYRVRLNITSLQIIENDYTFTRTFGRQIPFGTAGDCYSRTFRCPQGSFSIDLSRTSFKLAPRNNWIEEGYTTSSIIDMQENSVQGRCGGYCGNCKPNPAIGILLEIT